MSDSQWKGWIQLVLGMGLTFLFFYMMAPFVVATLIGAIVTIVCYPAYDRLLKSFRSSISAFIVTLGLSVGVLGPVLFVLYSGSYKIVRWSSELGLLKEKALGAELSYSPWIHSLLNSLQRLAPSDPLWFRKQALTFFQNTALSLYEIGAQSVSNMPNLVIGFFVIMLSIFFFLRDGERFLLFLTNLSPIKKERSQELYHAFETSCRAVVIGLFASAFAQGFLMWLLFLITSLPNAFLMGMLSIAMGMVPIVGTAPIWIGAILYLVANQSLASALVMLIGGIFISLSDNYIRTWILHGHSEMHPFLALVSVLGAMNLFGPSGIFLGPILAAVFVSFLKILSQEIRGEQPLVTSA